MAIQVDKLGVLLGKTSNPFESEGVLNPAAIKVDGIIHLFYRAVSKGNYSSIGYCRLSSPMDVSFRMDSPFLFPQHDYEMQGMEDPRIVRIDNTFYLSYTAYNGINALGALATSTDLIQWKKHGIMVPQITYEEFTLFTNTIGKINEKYARFNDYQQSHHKQDIGVFLWDKNLVYFPRRIDGKICFLHRIKPDIQIVVSITDLEELTIEFWKAYFFNFDEYMVLAPKFEHEVSYVGSGCPPIETPEGWLIIYHGVHDTVGGYVYSACAALLDLEKPQHEIARLPYPLFFPEKEWELKGEVNNVCFPTGAIVEENTLFIYYGAADERIAVASLNLQDLVDELIQYKNEE
jgi:predicted GH43/DUF377 family glycosyl hydrolase